MTLNTNINRVMLVFPPSTSLASWEPMVTTPMGIAYLGAVLRDAGYEVKLLDTVCEAPYKETVVSEHICRFGLDYHEIIERITGWQPHAVGLSCIFSNQWPAAAEIARRLKAIDPDMAVVAGGAHPTFLSELCMKDAPIDFIIKGEAEESFPELLSKLGNGKAYDDIDGLVWRDNGVVRENPKVSFIQDLDTLPFPAHDLLPTEKYFELALPMAYSFMSPRTLPVVTSRGCPCRCTFCSSTHLWGKRYRMRSAENVMAELDWLVDRFKIEEIKFQDDNLTVKRKRAEQIFNAMIERPYRLFWNTPNGIAVWTLDQDLLELMVRSGCFEITMAIESGNQEVLSNLIKKPLKLEKAREVNEAAKKLDLSRAGYFIIGFPGETREQIMDTVRFARELKLAGWGIFIYNPLPGSELYEECVRRGFITEQSFFEAGNQYFSSVIDSEEWTAEELESIIRKEYMRSYFTGLMFATRPVLRRWYRYFRYRPSFLKFFALRSIRAFKLQAKTLLKGRPVAGG